MPPLDHTKDFCSCSNCADVMAKAYRLTQDMLKEKHCVPALMGVSHALYVIACEMARGEITNMTKDEDEASEIALDMGEATSDRMDAYIEVREGEVAAMCKAIYQRTGMTRAVH